MLWHVTASTADISLRLARPPFLDIAGLLCFCAAQHSTAQFVFVPMSASKSNEWMVVRGRCRVVLRVWPCATWLTASLSLVGDPCVAAGPASRVPSSLRGALATSGRDVGRRQGGVSASTATPKIFDAVRVCSVLQLVPRSEVFAELADAVGIVGGEIQLPYAPSVEQVRRPSC